MASAFQTAGAASKPTRYAPIFTNEFFTGIWTQRNPLREAAVPQIYARFYGANRYDSLIDGLNTEISNRLTLIRRPGNSVYNSQTFPAINSFYEFRLFSSTSETIKVMADTATTVYDATGPNTQTAIFTKSAGAGQTNFQSVGDTLFFGDGLDQKKWIQSLSTWTQNSFYTTGQFIVDSNGNLEFVTGVLAAALTVSSSVTISSNVLTVTFPIALGANANNLINQAITFNNFTNASFLNGLTLTCTAISNGSSAASATFTYVHANYGPTGDSGAQLFFPVAGVLGESGGSQPTWPTQAGTVTFDSSVMWTNKGPALENWGIVAPTAAPNVANAALSSPYSSWAASTFYTNGQLVLDQQGTPHIWLLSTGGTTASVAWTLIDNSGHSDTTTGAPTGNAGTEVWTDQGQAAWQNTHTYANSAYIAVPFNKTIFHRQRDPESGEIEIVATVINYYDFFQAVLPGTSGSAQPTWSSGLGTTVRDGTVTWKNIGKVVTGNGATLNSVLTIAIGSSQAIVTNTQILDSNGNVETLVTPGVSGAAHPTWSTVVGGYTPDNTAVWFNQGPFSAAGTAPWTYAYAYKNSVTKHVSTASPLSVPIQLQATSYINVSGAGSTDPQVDTVEIYRTAQGGSTLFLLADIANSSQWSYQDTTPDSGLDEFIQAAINDANDPPPTGLVALTFHLQRIWGAVENTVFFSSGPDAAIGSGNESFPPANSFVFPSAVVRLQPISFGLLVHTVSDTYIIVGQGNSSAPFVSIPFLQNFGLANYNAYSVNGSVLYLMTNDGQVVALDPSSGVSEVGFPIGDKLQAFTRSSVYLTYHISGSSDKALFVADGTADWYRMSPTSAPESGLMWSPQATIVGGMKAVQSVETSPGVKQLLLGPSTSGPILARDLTTNADNGTAYSAFATIGSIVLAQPSQLAELYCLVTESKQGTGFGRRVSPSVLLDEISGTFETMPYRVDDPPFTGLTSQTLFSDRWYFSALKQPAWCRHMQVKFTWPTENAANELLSYTVVGAHHAEGG